MGSFFADREGLGSDVVFRQRKSEGMCHGRLNEQSGMWGGRMVVALRVCGEQSNRWIPGRIAGGSGEWAVKCDTLTLHISITTTGMLVSCGNVDLCKFKFTLILILPIICQNFNIEDICIHVNWFMSIL